MSDSHQPLKDRIEALAARFEDELRAYVAAASADPVDNLHEAMTYSLGTDIENPALRGKRIRPVLCLLTAESLGAPLEAAMPFALSIELMHNFALVHDDMEDGDIMRRGRDAAWVKYGPAHAINIGDYLLVHTTRALTDWGPASLSVEARFELLKLIASALDHTHIGQALDMNARMSRAITIGDYLRIVREKTGYYLAAPIQGGAIVAGAEAGILGNIGRMAQFLGPMFQIIDDIIDLTQGKGREAIGSDIREGKRSYLVAYTAEKCSPAEAARLFDILDTPRAETTAAMIAEVIELFARYNSIEAGRIYCNELYDESCKILATLPKQLGEPLGDLFEMLVHRSH